MADSTKYRSPFKIDRKVHSPISEKELQFRRSLIPKENRSITGILMGDPFPDDPRRSECKSTIIVNSVES